MLYASPKALVSPLIPSIVHTTDPENVRQYDLFSQVKAPGPIRRILLNFPNASSPFNMVHSGFLPRFNYYLGIFSGPDLEFLHDSGIAMNIWESGFKHILQPSFPYITDENGIFQVQRSTWKGPMTFTSTEWIRALLGADVANASGYDGTGVKVCIIDTGGTRRNPQTITMQKRTAVDANFLDEIGHGQWCAGACFGKQATDHVFSSQQKKPVNIQGMAPNASGIEIKGLDYGIGTGTDNQLLLGLQMASSLGIDILSLSWGSPPTSSEVGSDPFYIPLQTLTQEDGIIIVAAAGNSGPKSGTIDSPGGLPDPISVGSVNAVDNSSKSSFGPAGQVSGFSSRGPSAYGYVKPDILSYGAIIDSSITGWMMGCVSEDETVWTNPDGPKLIHQTKVGDMVYSFDDGDIVRRKVTAVMSKGMQSLISVRTRSRSIKVTDIHPLLVLDPEFKFKPYWKEVKDLVIGDILVLPRGGPSTNKIAKSRKWARLIGFMIGDGWIAHNPTPEGNYRIYLAMSIYPALNEAYLSLFEELTGRRMSIHKLGHYAYVSDKKLWFQFYDEGLHKRAKDKRVPNWIWSASSEEQEAFLAGIIDADGWKDPSRGYEIQLANRLLVQELHELCLMVGKGTSNIHSKRTCAVLDGRTIESECWGFAIYRSPGVGFDQSGRAKRMASYTSKFLFEKITEIQNAGLGTVYDLSVEGSHNFISNGFFAHNSYTGVVHSYQAIAGTSMATPIAAGLIACMRQAHMRLLGKKLLASEVKYMMSTTGAQHWGIHSQSNTYGWGLLTFQIYQQYMKETYGITV